MSNMNILVTAIGSMSAGSILESLNEMQDIKIYACDTNKREHLVLASRFKNFYQVSKATEESFVDEILTISKANDIQMILPLIDPEVDRLTQSVELFQKNNITIATPGLEAVRVCRNKEEFYKRLKPLKDIQLIPTFNCQEVVSKKLRYPLIAKPAMGRSSEGVYMVKDRGMLHYLIGSMKNYVFQEYIPGKVFTVDIARDSFGNLFTLAREEIIRTSNGAGLTVYIKENPNLHQIVNIVAKELNICGCINMEFISDGENYFLMDINPRFSAGVGLSKMAGYDFTKQCLNIFCGNRIETTAQITPGIYGKFFIDYMIE